MMRKIALFGFIALFAAACTGTNSKFEKTYVAGTQVIGDSITEGEIIEVSALPAAMKNESKKDLKITGEVKEVCKKKGCWMVMKSATGEDIRITFKDYKLFMPKDLAGKTVVLDGFAYTDTVSVDDQKHYAEDGGKSKEEIAAITKPKVSLAYEAKGVVIK